MDVLKYHEAGAQNKRNLKTEHPTPAGLLAQRDAYTSDDWAQKLARAVNEIGISLEHSTQTKWNNVCDNDGAQCRHATSSDTGQSPGNGKFGHITREGTEKAANCEPELCT